MVREVYDSLFFSSYLSFPLRWQRNWIHRGAPRPANPVRRHPAKSVCTRVRMIMILDVDETAERRHYNTYRPIGRYHNPQRRRRCRPLSEANTTLLHNLRCQPPPPPFGPFEPSEPGPQSGPFPYIKNIFSCIDVIVNLYYHRFKLTNAL